MSVMTEREYLAHYGILRKSGRYPWGSGGTQSKRNKMFLDTIADLKREGMSEAEIAKGFSTKEHPFTINDLRNLRSIALLQQKQERLSQVNKLLDKGMSVSAVARQMEMNESSVRSLLNANKKAKADSVEATVHMLRKQVSEKGAIDVGLGVELDLPLGDNPAARIGITSTKFKTAVAHLKEEGYNLHTVKYKQLGTGNFTTSKVLAPPTDDPKGQWRQLVLDPGRIKTLNEHSPDGGKTWDGGFKDPIQVSSKRIGIRYKEDGGDQADGVIYVRPGAKDLSLGSARYAQVRIAVDGTHYLKGMAVYKDDLPPGQDLVFNTIKSNTGNKKDAMKPMQEMKGEIDRDNPFGATTNQLKNDNGKVISAMNIVNEQGDWDRWSKSLPSQMLSKQDPAVAKKQLDTLYERQREEFGKISALTNPVVRQKLLTTFADGADSSAVDLAAAAMPKQATRVILPVPSMKKNEVFAPHLENGDRVALVRFPHGGTFEIPELTVNNRNREARKLIGIDPKSDAIGIHHSVAERLSGADFDGDTALVIPNNRREIKSSPALVGLKNFEPREQYKRYEGMKTVDGGIVQKDGTVKYTGEPRKANMQNEMGRISNLITDMTIQGANSEELARAVRHSMVVIDCEKHVLDHRASARDNAISALKAKYQLDPATGKSGAATLLSRATSEERIPKRKARPAAQGGPIDPATGKKVFVNTGESYVDKKGRTVLKTEGHDRLSVTDDARTLLSRDGGTEMERIYADHSNKLKSLANQARKDTLGLSGPSKSPSAAKVYSKEVSELNAALNLAHKNAPLERQAQRLANSVVAAKKAANPGMTRADEKKIEQSALAEMRSRTGAGKARIVVSDSQWAAIQAGAIAKSKLSDILDNADLDRVRELATPKPTFKMTSTKTSRAKQMMANGYTQAEIAASLGVSLTTLKTALGGE